MLRSLKHLKSLIYNTPLMLTEDKAHIIADVIDAGEFRRDLTAQDTIPEGETREQPVTVQSIAIIPVVGVLTHRVSGLRALSGGPLAYDTIRARIKAALDDPAITHIVLDIDSEGGSVNGVFDLVDYIYDARSIKPIIAIINECAASAAYAIASAASEIYAPRTALAGSIGVVAVLRDERVKDEKEGISYVFITAGSGKNALNPHSEQDAAAVDELQGKVDELYEIFLSTVARNRGIDVNVLRKMGAHVYLARAALKMGLIDKIMSVDKTIKSIVSSGGELIEMSEAKQEKQSVNLATETAEQVDSATATGEAITSAGEDIQTTVNLEEAAKADAKAAAELAQAVVKAMEAERTRIISMLQAVKLAGLHDPYGLLIDSIADGSTLDDFNAAVLDALHSQSGVTTVHTGVASMSTVDVLVADAEKRAKAGV